MRRDPRSMALGANCAVVVVLLLGCGGSPRPPPASARIVPAPRVEAVVVDPFSAPGACWQLEDGSVDCCGTAESVRPLSMARRVSLVAGACFAYAEGGGLCTPGDGQGERILDPEWTFEYLVATGEAVCGLRDGGVQCWLTPNDHTQPLPRHDLTGRPPDLELAEVTDLVASPWFFCALVRGDVWCWDAGTTHLGWAVGCGENEPTQMSALGDVTAIAVSSGAILCVLRRAGEVLCWGGNDTAYTMGGPTSEMWVSRTPRAVSVGTPLEWVRSVAPLAFCGAAADDSMWCWGFGPSGLLDLEDDEWLGPANLFEAVPVDLRATDVAGNFALGCVVQEGEVHCIARGVPLPSDCPGGLERLP